MRIKYKNNMKLFLYFISYLILVCIPFCNSPSEIEFNYLIRYMNIAIVSYSHSESSLVLAKYLLECGHSVDYYYVTCLGKKSAPGFEYGITPKRIGIVRIKRKDNVKLYTYLNSGNITVNLITLILQSPRFAILEKLIIKLSSKIIGRKHYDIINLVGQNELLIPFHKALSKYKRVHTLHEIDSHYNGQKISNKLISYLDSHHIPIIVHSKFSYDRFFDLVHPETNRLIKFIPFGLFESSKLVEVSNSKFDKYKPYVLFYGLIRPYKGLEILKQAVDLLHDEFNSIRFIVAGYGFDPVLQEMEKSSRFIVINKMLSNVEIVDLNVNARFVVCPYTSASQSGIITTSFFYGKPIIASRVGAFDEFITDGINGLLVAPNDARELADSIARLINDPSLYSILCTGAYSFSETYDWKEIANETLNFYDSCIDRYSS